MYSEKLAQFKKTVDQKTILAVLNANTENELRKLIQKYHIHIDVAEEAFSVLMLMCYGAVSSSDCFNIINDMKVVKNEDFANFITDINVNILKTIQEKIKSSIVSNENMPQQSYDEKLVNPTSYEIKQSVFDTMEESTETAEEILARIEKEANEEVDEEIRQRQQIEAQKAKEVEELRLVQDKKIEEEAGKEFDALPELDILEQELEDLATEEASIKQDATNKQMAQTQNQITADIDLDMVPKTSVNTYIHTNMPTDEPIEVVTPQAPNPITESMTQSVEHQDEQLNTSLSFIESKASGQIVSSTDTKNPPNQDSKNYMKDPYHEEL